MTTHEIASGTTIIDIEHLGRPRVIGTVLVEGDGARALIDPGPGSTLPTLRAQLDARGLRATDLDAILLTHIHFDHAGATGAIVAENPAIAVYVHERGASHMAAPERLLRSATRIYGDDMDRLWGDFLPVPEANLRVLHGGEPVSVGGRALDALYTPGHASHHIAYCERASGLAFIGDMAGTRIDGAPFVAPVTPPPDIDLDAWRTSVEAVRTWKPERLVPTHFGAVSDVEWHLGEALERLASWSGWVETSLATTNESDEQRIARFETFVRDAVTAAVEDPATVAAFLQAGPAAMCWHGLARCHRKRGLAPTS